MNMILTLEEQKRVFSARFRSLRKEGQTQVDFAASLGLSRASVINYINGVRMPDTMGLAKIATACNVTTDWLLGLTDECDASASFVNQDLKVSINNSLKQLSNLKDDIEDCINRANDLRKGGEAD